jgi:hypothetical protein
MPQCHDGEIIAADAATETLKCIPGPRRTYTLADIDRMRAAVKRLPGIKGTCGTQMGYDAIETTCYETIMQTYIAAGISPEALEKEGK